VYPLKYNTASQEIPLGYALDSTDGDTAETGLTIANTDIKLHKAGATSIANKNSGGATHMAGGIYYATLDATDTNTYGPMVVFVHVAGALTVRLECVVMNATSYDALYGTDNFDVNVTQWLGTAPGTPNTAGIPLIDVTRWLGTTAVTPATAGVPSVDTTYISGDSTAADNCEAQFDGTGYTDDTAPATQAQLAGIANVGSAINRPAASYVLTTGTQSANTFAATAALDGTRHEHTDTGGVMELYYEFHIGSGTPSSCSMTGYLSGANDDLDVYGYDWVASAWVQIGTLEGGSATNAVHNYDMFVDMVGSGANSGVVRLRFYVASGLTSATLAVDQIFIAYSQGTSGYDGGAVWFNSNASNTNTVRGVDGISTNPVSTEAAVNTLLASTGLSKVEVSPESEVTFATDHTNEVWLGIHWILHLGGVDVSGFHAVGAEIDGLSTGTTTVDLRHCEIGDCTLPPFHVDDCGFAGTLTLYSAGTYVAANCHSEVAGAATPVIDTGAAIGNVDLSLSNYHQGIEVRNLNATGTDRFSISGIGQIVYAATCSGTVNQRGMWKATNTGGVTIVTDDNITNIAATLADTNELQTDWTNGGRLDLILDATLAMLDDARGEPGQGAPPASADMATKIDYLYKLTRNKKENDGTTTQFYDDAGTTVDHKSTTSEAAGTVTLAEIVTGP